jgi:hypothetical protein
MITRGTEISVGTRRYKAFVNEIRAALVDGKPDDFDPLLDGRAGARCLDLLHPSSIQRLGAFFTPSIVAVQLVSAFSDRAWFRAKVFDPACGAADLLLPIAATLPIRRTVSSTLRLWNDRISGCDLSPQFIEAARLRLLLLAVKRGASLDGDPNRLAGLLTNLWVSDGLAVADTYGHSSHILMNPPFGRVSSGRQSWREGTITAAALFVERAARLSAPGTQIVALLPEVLRTGSSYANWRDHVGRFATRSRPQSIGLFSDHADVDVYIQRFTRRRTPFAAPSSRCRKPKDRTVGDKFAVWVGAVVPHRHKKSGPELAYLHAGNTRAWSEVQRIAETRHFLGRTFMPPFVVVRRTSRPGDSHRTVATLVLGKRKVAVENHLLVLVPTRGGAAVCRALVKLLRSPNTTDFLNRTMRCRHLTTASVSCLPWT